MDLFESGIDNMSIGGYLICENCNGYYQLQEGESPSDFDMCECGGHLNYQETHNFISKKKNGTDTTQLEEEEEEQLDYEEIQEMVINLKNKAEKRKKQFEELSKKVEIQEEILTEIKNGKLPMWEKDPSKNIKAGFRHTPKPWNNMSGNSDIYPFDEKSLKETMEKEEKKLMARIQEKRTSVRNQKSSTSFKENFSMGNISPIKVLLIITVIVLIIAMYLYFFK